MADNTKTAAQLRKDMAATLKAYEGMQKDLNKIAQSGIEKEIKAVEDSLGTLLNDDSFDISDLKKRLTSLLRKCCGNEHEVIVKKKSNNDKFEWSLLLDKMKDNGMISKETAAHRGTLEEMYFGKKKKKFNQKWNDKPEEIVRIGKSTSARYFVK